MFNSLLDHSRPGIFSSRNGMIISVIFVDNPNNTILASIAWHLLLFRESYGICFKFASRELNYSFYFTALYAFRPFWSYSLLTSDLGSEIITKGLLCLRIQISMALLLSVPTLRYFMIIRKSHYLIDSDPYILGGNGANWWTNQNVRYFWTSLERLSLANG
jgi:hypothetical protein